MRPAGSQRASCGAAEVKWRHTVLTPYLTLKVGGWVHANVETPHRLPSAKAGGNAGRFVTSGGRIADQVGRPFGREHHPAARLCHQPTASGALITQFPFNRNADKQSFAIRNRIIAGMTLGTVVVEADLHSGALITANFATEYGRQVFAVPGRIDSPRSKGCHDLIKKGAKLCESAEDVLSEFEYLFPSSNRPPSPGETGVLPALTLSENEQKVYDVLSNEELSIDEVIRKSGLPSSAVSVALLSLEMKRVIRQLLGKLFVGYS
jgi:DNA processing protein